MSTSSTHSISPTNNRVLLLFIKVGLIGVLLVQVSTTGGCADSGEPVSDLVYEGPLIVYNRSQFTYTGLYLYPKNLFNAQNNLLNQPLQPEERVTIYLRANRHIGASRPKVVNGRDWLISSAEPLTFYRTQPEIWILDNTFILYDQGDLLEDSFQPINKKDLGVQDQLLKE